jgi:hypothetical protein
MMRGAWTEEEIKTLKVLRANGLTFKEIERSQKLKGRSVGAMKGIIYGKIHASNFGD